MPASLLEEDGRAPPEGIRPGGGGLVRPFCSLGTSKLDGYELEASSTELFLACNREQVSLLAAAFEGEELSAERRAEAPSASSESGVTFSFVADDSYSRVRDRTLLCFFLTDCVGVSLGPGGRLISQGGRLELCDVPKGGEGAEIAPVGKPCC